MPRLLHSQATDFVATEYGRKIEIGEIQFNPFTLVLKVHGLSFPDAEGQPLVGFRELLVNLNASSLFRMAPSFAAIELDRAIHECDRAQGRHAQSRWISRGLSAQRPTPAAEAR